MAKSVSEPFRLAVNAPLVGAQAFATRRSQPGVVRWIGFDSSADLGTINLTRANYPGPVKGSIQDIPGYSPVVDRSKSASADGGGSLKFSVPANGSGTQSGDWWINFSDNASVLFDEGQRFRVQFRVWYSREAIDYLLAVRGYKISHLIAGDSPIIGNPSSCDVTEIVLQAAGFPDAGDALPILYHRCPSDGGTINAEFSQNTAWNNINFNLQNARPDYCARYLGRTYTKRVAPSQSPPGSCFGLYAREWLTFKYDVTLGEWRQMESFGHWGYAGSRVEVWAARQGQASQKLWSWNVDLRAGFNASARRKYGKIWFDTYGGGNTPHPEFSVWYDELIISRNEIADPL